MLYHWLFVLLTVVAKIAEAWELFNHPVFWPFVLVILALMWYDMTANTNTKIDDIVVDSFVDAVVDNKIWVSD